MPCSKAMSNCQRVYPVNIPLNHYKVPLFCCKSHWNPFIISPYSHRIPISDIWFPTCKAPVERSERLDPRWWVCGWRFPRWAPFGPRPYKQWENHGKMMGIPPINGWFWNQQIENTISQPLNNEESSNQASIPLIMGKSLWTCWWNIRIIFC